MKLTYELENNIVLSFDAAFDPDWNTNFVLARISRVFIRSEVEGTETTTTQPIVDFYMTPYEAKMICMGLSHIVYDIEEKNMKLGVCDSSEEK